MNGYRGANGYRDAVLGVLWACLAAVVVLILPAGALSGQASTQNPHEDLPEGFACASCHSTTAWSPLRSDLQFDHGDLGFALDGQHTSLACVACHSVTRFDDVSAGVGDCASCHVDVHQEAFDRTCVACHTTDSFRLVEAWAVHPANFPLEGSHLQVTCESCHTDDFGGAYVSLDIDCAACHADEYASTVLVDHVALAFPTECTQCHSNFAWRDVADFDHTVSSGGFELQGTHIGLECLACHVGSGGSIPNPPVSVEDCVACHQTDYQGEHGGSGFPTDCVSCHQTTAWDQVTFEHDAFPIFSGAHRGEWDSCATCHTEPANPVSFTCLTCHEQSKADDKHKDEPGYLYESASCYSCHMDGKS